MATINSFFEQGGAPALGLSPTIRIWDVETSGNTLVVTDAAVSEVGDGFYTYYFAGYNPTKSYVIRVDGGSVLIDGRYNVAALDAATPISSGDVQAIVNGVWDEQTVNHLQAGSFGFMDQQIKADTSSISINLLDAITLVQTLLKYERNHTKIDMNLCTLTIYDNDGVTPITVFSLFDQNGMASVAQVAERVPH